ncbi:YgcG family protein [Ramlibacter sp. AN1015]|uniref:TPM domain-containing protein n=1 Tax=Ramlibacter sp. AN1015 TaxID=3133428 RepID=UPI0030C40D0E
MALLRGISHAGDARFAAQPPALGRLLSIFLLLIACMCLPAGQAAAQDVQPVPPLSARVVDRTGTLAPPQQQALEAQLAALEQETGAQVVVLMVPTSEPEDLFSYANRVANEWKIGRREVGDGVLIVVAKDDRRVRIEVAKTLEGALPDLRARQIIDEAITPAFRQGDFAGGLAAAVGRIGAHVRGEALPAPTQAAAGTRAGGFDWMELAVLLFIAVPVAGGVLRAVFGRPLGSIVAGGAVGALAFVVTTSLVVAVLAGLVGLLVALLGGMGGPAGRGIGRHRGPPFGGPGWGGTRHHGGWGGGLGGGGGFRSGGGGNFGGGGASGGW